MSEHAGNFTPKYIAHFFLLPGIFCFLLFTVFTLPKAALFLFSYLSFKSIEFELSEFYFEFKLSDCINNRP